MPPSEGRHKAGKRELGAPPPGPLAECSLVHPAQTLPAANTNPGMFQDVHRIYTHLQRRPAQVQSVDFANEPFLTNIPIPVKSHTFSKQEKKGIFREAQVRLEGTTGDHLV